MVGAALLWVGWFGFNAGSALKAGADAGMTMLATHLAAATATCVWVAIEWIKYGKPSLVGAVTGTVAGLATITPASGFVGPLGAVALGFVGGLVCYGAVGIVKRGFKVDDALDVLGVHGVGGALGSLLLPFATVLGAGGTGLARPVLEQVSIQAQGIVVTLAWSVAATFVIVKIVASVAGLRTDPKSRSRASTSPITEKRAIIATPKDGENAMKLVIAIIQPHKLDSVRAALVAVGNEGMTVTEVRGYGRQKGHKEIYRGAEYAISFVPKLKLEVAVTDERAEDVISAIRGAARSGAVGDGKIFVVELDAAMRVRTGETDADAL